MTMTEQEAVEMYHEWRLLKQRTDKLEKSLKQYTAEHGDIAVAPSKVWGPKVTLSESVNAEADDFERSMRNLLGDVYELAVKTSMPKQALEAACGLIAKRQGLTVKEVHENMWGDLKALGFIVAEHKTVYGERSVDL
jgi:hypothetical protein